MAATIEPVRDLHAWCLGQRPVLAYSSDASARQRRAALRLFHASSWKRRCIKTGVWILGSLGVHATCRDASSVGVSSRTIDRLLQMIAERQGQASFDWLIVWPARPERRRLYLLFQIAGTHEYGLVKIGYGEFNQRQLRNEAEMLCFLSTKPHPFLVPTVVFQEPVDADGLALCFWGFPRAVQPLRSGQAQETAKLVIQHATDISASVESLPLSSLPWLVDSSPSFMSSATATRLFPDNTTFSVGWAHGDLGPGNMMVHPQGQILLYDWENASSQAPILTDPVGFWLSLRQHLVLRTPGRAMQQFRRDFSRAAEVDLVLALLFLSVHDHLAARRLLDHWL